MQYLVDTDWVIDNLHGRQPVVNRLSELSADGLGLSVVSLAELYEGVFHSTQPQAEELGLREFLPSVEILPLDDEVCRIFGRERGRLRASGNLIGDLDLLIGCTALRYGLTILSNNRRHFERIQGLNIIST